MNVTTANSPASLQGGPRDNILFFMTDQQHADCLSFRGHPIVKTPNLDQLAARGAYFNHMYTCSAICAPSRTSFHTGAYLRTHGHYFNDGDLRQALPSLPAVLQAHGYLTAQCGKLHLPQALARHYQRLWDMPAYQRDLAAAGLQPDAVDNRTKKEFYSFRSELPEEWSPEVWTANRAIQFIGSAEARSRPWFLWCSFERPHAPHSPPKTFDDLYPPEAVPVDWKAYEQFECSRLQNRPMLEDFWKIGAVRHDVRVFQKAVCRYLALITLIDREIGRVLAALQTHGFADQTIVIFTSDHGDWAGHYGQLGKNLPGYDDLIRIPFIYRDPRRPDDAGRVVEGMFQSIDLMPTLLERLHLEVPPTCQGVGFLSALDGWPGAGRDYVFAETAVCKTIRSPQWKLNFFARHPSRGQLFRMGPRPDETNNLWDDHTYAEVKAQLMQELAAWMVRSEQPGSMCSTWETHPETRWYRWLAQQPGECAVANPPPNRCGFG